ncbi:MAG: polysaccharide biosynthesis tyrosine autokinase [Actinomycetota bacterium]|nr:polysaccharide biosynthesis tyrosine autokinase [Actinomycetota bacterium]
MQLRRFLTVLGRRWLTVLFLTMVGAAVAAGFSFLTAPVYASHASVFFSIQFGTSASELVQGATYTQNSVTSFATLATKPIVLDAVIEDLGLETSAGALAQRVVAIAPLDTVLVEITVNDFSPEDAAAIAGAIADELSATVERLSPRDASGVATVQAEIVAPATIERSPVSPNISLNFAAGILLGLAAGVGLAFARETLDTRVRGAADVQAITEAPVLGVIGTFPGGTSALVLQDIPSSAQAEAYRHIRTNLQFLGVNDQARSIVVTSALPAEGKSTVAANLALALAEASTRVLLIDADLRRPNIADLMSLEGAAGLTTVLIGRADFEDVVQEWGEGSLHVLTSGALPPNPSELLASPTMKRLLIELDDRYDVVIIDTSPLLPVTDAAILSRVAIGTIVVANARRVRRGQLAEGLGFLDQVDARVLGVVLNEAVKDSERYGYTAHAMKSDADMPQRIHRLAARSARESSGRGDAYPPGPTTGPGFGTRPGPPTRAVPAGPLGLPRLGSHSAPYVRTGAERAQVGDEGRDSTGEPSPQPRPRPQIRPGL